MARFDRETGELDVIALDVALTQAIDFVARVDTMQPSNGAGATNASALAIPHAAAELRHVPIGLDPP